MEESGGTSLSRTITVFCVVLVVCSLTAPSDAKTVTGVMTTRSAQLERGQYIASFCFHGDGVVEFTLNATGTAKGRLLLFLNEDWKDALEDASCQAKLGKARAAFDLTTTGGNYTIPNYHHPRIWHAVYTDIYTCEENESSVLPADPNFLAYTIHFFNPDYLGNPTEHFGDDETGLLKFYKLLTLTYFVMTCICAPRLKQTLSKGGPMKLVIELLTASVFLQAIGAFLQMLHLQRYSYDGIGSPFKELLSEFFDVLSQFAMLYMLLSLSLGWTLSSARSHSQSSHLNSIRRKPAAQVVGALGVLQGVLFMWEQYKEMDHRQFHAHRSYAGVALVVLRILLAALFAWNLYRVMRGERSAIKREFYSTFTKACMLWFLCYPAFVVSSWIFAVYLRYKLITMGVLLCQSISGILLYRLFLSRSLYWEVSALSSSLPLHFDRNFGLKMYS